MSDKSLIQWTDATWLFWPGCVPKSAGCLHCYAKKDAWRMAYNPNPKIAAAYKHIVKKVLADGTEILGGDEHPRRHEPGTLKFTGIVRSLPDKLDMPLRWRDPRRIFVSANSDLFLPARMAEPKKIAAAFSVMAAAKQHTFQVLTKWPENASAWFEWLVTQAEATEGRAGSWAWTVPAQRVALQRFADELSEAGLAPMQLQGNQPQGPWPLPNVWLGASVEDKPAKKRIDDLRKIDAAVRFLSIEPLIEDLGEIDLTGIGWVIVGGESGKGSRECRVEWLSQIVAQCREQRVPVFVKQLGANPADAGGVVQLKSKKGGAPEEWPEHLRIRQMPEVRP